MRRSENFHFQEILAYEGERGVNFLGGGSYPCASMGSVK